MTDLATALADKTKLTPYQGRDVLNTSIAIRNAGDGLSEAMGIDPVELAIGTKVTVVLECEVKAHDYQRIKDTDALTLTQVLKAGTATLIDADVVREALAEQEDRILRAREAAKGIVRLPTGDELDREHGDGLHAGELVAGCPSCDAEQEAAAGGD